jgi:hypothetical protein
LKGPISSAEENYDCPRPSGRLGTDREICFPIEVKISDRYIRNGSTGGARRRSGDQAARRASQ